MQINYITSKVIHMAHVVYSKLGGSLLERCYESALCIELNKLNIKHERQKSLPVIYEGQNIGDYYCDLCVESLVIVELKACSNISKKHYSQLIHYMKVAGVKVGLIINFSEDSLQVKRIIL